MLISLSPAAALAAGVIESALAQAQDYTIALAAAAAFGWIAGRIDARAKVAAAKAPAERGLADKMAMIADRQLDQIDRDHLESVINNVLSANVDRVLASVGVPPKAAADDFVDDLYLALRERNPLLADRLDGYLDRQKAKDLIAAGIGRITMKGGAAGALLAAPEAAAGMRG